MRIIQIGNFIDTGNWRNPIRGRVYLPDELSPTMNARGGDKVAKILVHTEDSDMENEDYSGYKIRRITPRESWRLMGFTDEDFDKAQSAGISNTQLYKQAGNSIVVDVLYYIYKELYNAMPELFDDLKVSSFFSGIGAFESALDMVYKDINSDTNKEKK